MTSTIDTTRNATLDDLAGLLKDQHARKIDAVVPAHKVSAEEGSLRIVGAEPMIEDDGVTEVNGLYVPTRIADEGIAEKLGIPVRYLRRLREERTDIWDANVNGWLHGSAFVDFGVAPVRAEYDPRSFLIRCFRGDESGTGIARAFLSDRYRPIDNLDVLMAALSGIQAAGVQVHIDGCDLSESRMYVRVVAPEVTTMAETLLHNYRNPFEGIERWREVADREGLGYGGEEPIVFAGLVISNSEVGNGAFSIVPRAVVRVCKNGLTINADMMREVHLGGRLEEGTIDWSDATQQKAVDLIRSKTADAVRTFLSADYLTRTIERLEERAEEKVSAKQVTTISKSLKFTDSEIEGILDKFVKGGQTNRAGLANAITAEAQDVADADQAAVFEERAVAVLS